MSIRCASASGNPTRFGTIMMFGSLEATIGVGRATTRVGSGGVGVIVGKTNPAGPVAESNQIVADPGRQPWHAAIVLDAHRGRGQRDANQWIFPQLSRKGTHLLPRVARRVRDQRVGPLRTGCFLEVVARGQRGLV